MWDTRLNYQLLGDNSQVLEINIEPNKTLIADGAVLLYTDEEIILELKDDDGVSNVVENSLKDKNQDEDENEEEIESFPNFANPNWEFEEEENENPIPKKNKFKDFDEEEEGEKNQGLLEKFWGATKKNFGKIFKPKNKNEEEQEEENLPDLDNIFSRNQPKEKTKSSFYDDFSLDNSNEVGNDNDVEAENSFSWYLTHCTNQSEYIRTLAFTAGSQGRFVVIDLNEPYENTIIIQNGCFVCGRKGVKLNTFIDTDILISKENQKFLKLDSLVGNDYVFLKAGGFVIVKDLENDGIRINANALLAYEYSLDLIWENAEKVTAMNTDNENYLVTLSGTGRFWLQTNYPKLMYENISPFIPKIIPQEKEHNVVGNDNSINDFLLSERERIDKEKDKEGEEDEEKEDLDMPKL